MAAPQRAEGQGEHSGAKFGATGSPASRGDAGRLLDLAPDAILGVRPDGRIEFTNARVEALFGYPRDELIGKRVEMLIPERFRSGHQHERSRYFSDPSTRPMDGVRDLRGLRKNGREFRCEISLSAMVDKKGPLAIAVIRDVADRQGDPPDPGPAERIDELVELIEQERFNPVFQPIVHLATGAVAGHEALTRFEVSPELGPIHWFERAAQLGLSPQLELMTMRGALAAFAAAVSRLGSELGFVAVNISPETLALGSVEEAFNHFVPLDRIVVEVTEHAEIFDYGEFDRATERLWDSGVRLAVDDVGAGYASLRHLLSLDPDFIKLDVSLTRDINTDTRRRAIVSGLISFAKQAGCTVIAEGVETEEESAELRHLGVALGQGYWFGRPGPLPVPSGERPG